MAGSAFRVSIPENTGDMIQNIKEITGNHSEEEILAMLQECAMDPDETIQRLLLQDSFHEVKRKRDKKKENLGNKDSIESRWRHGPQGRGNRSSRVNFSSRYTLHDTGSAKNSSKRENGTKQVVVKAADPSVSTSQDTKNRESAPVSSTYTNLANGSTGVPSGTSNVQHASDSPASIGQLKPSASPIATKKPKCAPSAVGTNKNQMVAFNSGAMGTELKSTGSSDACPSPSDPVSGVIQREQHATENKFRTKSHGVGENLLTDSSQLSRPTSAHSNNVGSRPSSNYSSRSQQKIGSQKAGSNKEWKPKSVNPNPSQVSGAPSACEVPVTTVEASDKSLPVLDVFPSEEATVKLQEKLEDLHIARRQHVIIPTHIQVPESEKTKLSFGSFDAGFDLTSSSVTGSETEKSSTPRHQTAQDVEETLEEEASSNQNASATEREGDYPDKSEVPSQVPNELSDGAVSTNTVQEYNEPKQESPLMSGNYQHSTNYSIGLMPPVPHSQVPPLEDIESQARDASRVPSFVVQQPFDPASYYPQFYPSVPDTDGRVSPFLSPGVATKYNGNVTVLPLLTSQSPQEAVFQGGNSSVQSTASPSPPLVTQNAGLMQSSIAVTQPTVPAFRPPAGMQMSHYPPNYFPYGYFPPFYVPPTTIHPFLSNASFAQQPQASSVYPAPPPNAAAGVKYSLPQYKTGINPVNLTHIGMPGGYGPYGSFLGGYNHGSTTSAGNSTANEDLNPSQLKESNVYSTGQQSEASPVWIARPGRDMPVSSFYNVPPQGQHVTFAPTHAAHGAFASIYHPGQAVAAANLHPLLQQSQPMAGAVDLMRPATNVYQQQPQQTQMNWPSNY